MKLPRLFKIFIATFLISLLVFVVANVIQVRIKQKNELRQKVEKLLFQTAPSGGVSQGGTSFVFDYAVNSVYEAEKQLVELGEDAVPFLIELFERGKENTNVVYILATSDNERATNFLISVLLLQSEEPRIRARIANLLEFHFDNLKVMEALIQASRDENELVSRFALRSLKEIKQKSKK